jgi:hypothetical protein
VLAPSNQIVKAEISFFGCPHGRRFPKNYDLGQEQHECACTACTYDDSKEVAQIPVNPAQQRSDGPVAQQLGSVKKSHSTNCLTNAG